MKYKIKIGDGVQEINKEIEFRKVHDMLINKVNEEYYSYFYEWQELSSGELINLAEQINIVNKTKNCLCDFRNFKYDEISKVIELLKIENLLENALEYGIFEIDLTKNKLIDIYKSLEFVEDEEIE